MKPQFKKRTNKAMTFIEVMVVIAALIVLAAMLLPMLAPHARIRSGPNCASNLKQIGLAARIWANDNNNKYPMFVSVTNGGSMELIASGNVAGCFRVISNELSTTKILICPADADHVVASNFSNFNNSNISYFVNVEATESYPQMLFSGDDNLTVNGRNHPVKSGILEITTNTEIGWMETRHIKVGNISFADGSVAEVSASGLQSALQNTGVATNRLAIP